MKSLPVFSGVRVARSLDVCIIFCGSLFVLLSCFSYHFLLANVLSIVLRFMASDYPFGIFKLFLLNGVVFNATFNNISVISC